uniref:Alpha-2-macroglobulin domain-containing protein n=1 Tax=Anopheles dirus TaxID=7168 RepID=A0A182NV98_9DIPT
MEWNFFKTNKVTRFHVNPILASEKMVPQAKIVVVTVSENSEFCWDYITVDFPPLDDQLDIILNEGEVKPGHEVEVILRGRPRSYVGLAGYGSRLHEFSAYQDIFMNDVKELFNGLFSINAHGFDAFVNTGLFLKSYAYTSHELRNCATEMEKHVNDADVYQQPTDFNSLLYRSSFLETWLWKNETIAKSGTRRLAEIIPNSTTEWYLTGFAIHPEYGLRIIKKPTKFATVPPFYIVDSLPHSIIRGEETELPFMLFSNRDDTIIVDVTLHNYVEQIESLELTGKSTSYTRSVIVAPNEKVPVSFMVESQTLGEMGVRVVATLPGFKSDAIKKVIRVLPENLPN